MRMYKCEKCGNATKELLQRVDVSNKSITKYAIKLCHDCYAKAHENEPVCKPPSIQELRDTYGLFK
jgi:NAD-dependent SIR2 family protein deacetylase